MGIVTFRIVTFNCFGIPIPSLARRMATLARTLNQHPADLVCLQEVQLHLVRRMIVRGCHGLPYAAFEPFLYAPKGGLLTLARSPIEAQGFTLYPERGRRLALTIADVALHKGALLTRLQAHGRTIVAINTHLSANYAGDWSPSHPYARTERDQLQRLASLVAAQPADAIVLVGGDFNVPRHSQLYEEFITASGLQDPFANDMRPTYRPMRAIPARFAAPLDWLLIRAPELLGMRIATGRFLEDAQELVGGGQGFISDHIGLELALSWETPHSVLQ
jgi:endonuclease/exonuclease/phosphatase family metal-dependent hydrolase